MLGRRALPSWRQTALPALTGISVLVLIVTYQITSTSQTTSTSEKFDTSEDPGISFVVEAVPGVSFVVEPPTLRVCDGLTIAKVSWNAANAGIKLANVFVLDENARENLFISRGEAVGSANTGPWVGPGTVFVLRDNDSKKRLAKFTIGFQSCN